jgi:long-chain acyl-CoA synthetase
VYLPQVDAVLDDVQQGSDVAHERQELDNAAFAAKVTAVAALFAAAGLRPGGVLAIMLPNRVELVTSMFAAWRLGTAVTPVNPALTAQEARYQIADPGAALVVADNEAAAALGTACTGSSGWTRLCRKANAGDHSSYGGPSTAQVAGCQN